MKKILFVIFTLLSFTSQSQEVKPAKSDAVVTQKQGIYVFVDCTPKREYKHLGEISYSNSFFKEMDGAASLEDTKNGLVKKCRKSYPDADAIIIYLSKDKKDRADCIKFVD